jgi:hypothetical protein
MKLFQRVFAAQFAVTRTGHRLKNKSPAQSFEEEVRKKERKKEKMVSFRVKHRRSIHKAQTKRGYGNIKSYEAKLH